MGKFSVVRQPFACLGMGKFRRWGAANTATIQLACIYGYMTDRQKPKAATKEKRENNHPLLFRHSSWYTIGHHKCTSELRLLCDDEHKDYVFPIKAAR